MAIKESLKSALSKKVGESDIDYSQLLFVLGVIAIGLYIYSKKAESNAAAKPE